MTQAPTITLTKVEKSPKRSGGYKPGQRALKRADGTYEYVPDWTRGYRERDERQNKTRVYIWPEKETVLDNFVGRFSRPVPLMRLAMKAAFVEAGIDPATKATWSQRAGCFCGCSPAFILDARLGYDIHVSFNASVPAVDPAKAGIAAERAAAIAQDATMPDGFREAAMAKMENWTEAEKRFAYGDL